MIFNESERHFFVDLINRDNVQAFLIDLDLGDL